MTGPGECFKPIPIIAEINAGLKGWSSYVGQDHPRKGFRQICGEAPRNKGLSPNDTSPASTIKDRHRQPTTGFEHGLSELTLSKPLRPPGLIFGHR